MWPHTAPEEDTLSRRFHFISGLPRAGSTLLGALLAQNPRFHAGMSSPVAGMFRVLLEELSVHNEFSVFYDDGTRRRVLRGLFDNYYAEHRAEVVFDTSRMWCAHMSALSKLFPESRVIACVRDVGDVINSVERLINENSFSPSAIFDHKIGGTVYSRAEGLAGANGMVGIAYNSLKQAYYGEQGDRLLLVEYQSLCSDPAGTLAAIYDFVGEASFTHDFEHVAFDDRGFDARLGTPGMHSVRAPVAAHSRAMLLPPDLLGRYANDSFWRDPHLQRANVRIV